MNVNNILWCQQKCVTQISVISINDKVTPTDNNSGIVTFIIQENINFHIEVSENKNVQFSPPKFMSPWILSTEHHELLVLGLRYNDIALHSQFTEVHFILFSMVIKSHNLGETD